MAKTDRQMLADSLKAQRKVDPAKYPIAGLTEQKRTELLQNVLDRAMQDEKLKDIAKDIGVSKTGLSQALLRYCEDDWKSVQIARAVTALDEAQDDMELAADILAVHRAREKRKSAEWQLERLHRRLFGQDQQVSSGGQVQINIGIVRRPEQSNGQDDTSILIIKDK